MNFDLFTLDSGEFWSERLQNHLELRLKLSESGKTGANNRWGNRVAIGEGNAKERKEKETKVKESKVNIIDDSFEEWWFSYDKKTGKEKAYNKWKILLPQEKDLALSVVHKYVQSTPDKQWRKDPTTYLNSKSFNDEIIERTISTKLSYAELEWERLKNLG